jgi:hypothetical protein
VLLLLLLLLLLLTMPLLLTSQLFFCPDSSDKPATVLPCNAAAGATHDLCCPDPVVWLPTPKAAPLPKSAAMLRPTAPIAAATAAFAAVNKPVLAGDVIGPNCDPEV